MKIKVIRKRGAEEIRVKRAVRMDELIRRLNLKKRILEWHYEQTDEAYDVRDLESEGLEAFVATCVAAKYDYGEIGENNYAVYARKIIAGLYDELVDEIMSLDREAVEDARDLERVRREAITGEY